MDLKKKFDYFIPPANMELNQTPNHKSYPCEHEMQIKEEKSSTSDNIFHEEVNSSSYICKENHVIDNVSNTLITGVCLDSSSNGFAAQDGIIINLKDKNNSPLVEPGGIDILAINDFDSVLITEKTKPIEIYYGEENLNDCVDSDVPLLSLSVESDTSIEMAILNPLAICNIYSERNQSDSDVSLLSISGDEVSNCESEEYFNYDLAYVTASDSKSDKCVNPLNLSSSPTDTFHSYNNILNDSKEAFIIPEAKQLAEAFMDQTESIDSVAKCYSNFIENSELASSPSTNGIYSFTEKTFTNQNVKRPVGEIINHCDQKLAEITMKSNTLTCSTNNNISDTPTTLCFYDKRDSSLVDCSQDGSLMKDFHPHSPAIVIDSSISTEISTQHLQTCLEESLTSNTSQLTGNGQQQYGEAIHGALTLEKHDSCDSTLPLIELVSVDPFYSLETNNFNKNTMEIEPSFSKEINVPLIHLFGSSNLISTSHCSSQEHVNLSDACIHMLNNLNNSYSNISLMPISSLKNIQESYKDNMSVISSDTIKITNHWKNVIAYSIGFMVMYMAFGSLRHLQSSINNSNGIGLITLSCLFAFFVIGSLFASYVVKQLEPRRATLVTVLFHILYVISNCYPSIYILMPASAMLGFWNAVSWGAQGVYIQRLACDYAIKKGQKIEHICSKFHGVFYLILFFSEVFGNLISSLILSSNETGSLFNEQNQTEFHYKNSTIDAITNISHRNQQCGINYSHLKHEDEKTIPISQDTIFLLTAIFTGLDILAFAIIFFFVDPLTANYSNISPQTARNCEQLWRDLKSVIIFMKDWRFLLLIPIYLFSAMHLAYISAEITKAFATCMLGVHMVGYLMICYGISDALSSYISGWLNQITGRILLITIGSLSFQLVILSLFLWQPVSNSLIPYILIFGFWGLSDGFYASQLCSLTGILFSEKSEEAFSAFRMMQGVGLTVAYAYASSLSLDIKLYILSGVGIVAWIMYMLMEYCLRKNEHAKRPQCLKY